MTKGSDGSEAAEPLPQSDKEIHRRIQPLRTAFAKYSRRWKTLLLGLVVGALLAGIALAIVSTLYAQDKSRQSSGQTSTTIKTTTTTTIATTVTTGVTVTVPKRIAFYYGWPSLAQGASGNLSAATSTFSQFDLIVFGDGIASVSHGDHANTQTIIGSLNAMGKLAYGYIDLGVTTQNLSVTQMQTTVNGWAAMGVKGIMWDDAGYDYGVTRSRQTTMVSYCHSLNLGVLMNAWNPDDCFTGTPMVLDSRDIYLLESYLISNGAYQNLTSWKIKADKCASYAAQYGVSMACLATSTSPISASYGTSQQFSAAWFGTAMYNFGYFQATDFQYSATNNALFAFSNPISSYGTTWKTSNVQTDAPTHYYRSTDTTVLHMYGDGAIYGSGNSSSISNG